MKLLKIILIITVSFFYLPLFAESQQPSCPDLKQISLIGKDLKQDFEEKLCQKPMSPMRIKWLVKNSLPKILNKEFLGAEPPENWETLLNNLIDSCYQQGDLCKKEIQQEVNNCLKTAIPLVIVQLGPWFGDNCTAINQTFIKNWAVKKNVIDQLIKEESDALVNQSKLD
ncbi:Uncharacterised protein [Legionella busanensis]|uniref:Uncharacterized protein n=1 Tax=Legionella busanensis TaxID=190655 RepID=A0A378JPD0_9GAMM|nr:hypothetical protein [Legionella busanensis]STX52049.1 Uncharacterised protein [Legionella busanensis]